MTALRTLKARATTGGFVLGFDCSHWQGPIDFGKVKAAGFVFVVLKATEGNGYVDPNFRTYRAQAHAAGLIVLMYHYVGSSSAKRVYDAASEATWFVKAVSPLAVGEGVALDYEPTVPPPNPTAWCRAWLDTVNAQVDASPWIYLNSSTEARYNWSAAGIPALYGLWLAKYDDDPDPDAVVHWPGLAAEQYWDKATIPGVPGPVDIDAFYGTRAQLLAYCKSGATPQEDDLTPDQAQMLTDVHAWLRGGDPAKDNVTLLWEMLKGGNAAGENNFNWVDTRDQARIDTLAAKVDALATAQVPAVDPAALAEALLADDAAVKKLGDAIAAGLATRVGNG